MLTVPTQLSLSLVKILFEFNDFNDQPWKPCPSVIWINTLTSVIFIYLYVALHTATSQPVNPGLPLRISMNIFDDTDSNKLHMRCIYMDIKMSQ